MEFILENYSYGVDPIYDRETGEAVGKQMNFRDESGIIVRVKMFSSATGTLAEELTMSPQELEAKNAARTN